MAFRVRQIRSSRQPRVSARKLLKWTPLLLWPLMRFLQVTRRMKAERDPETSLGPLLKRTTLIASALVVILLMLAILGKGVLALQLFSPLKIATVAGSTLPKDANGHTNVLLLGVGDDNHDGIDLTDTVMITSLDPEKTKGIVFLSIPRDLYVTKTEKMGTGRINTLYRDYKIELIRSGMDKEEASTQSLNQLATELGNLMNIQIHRVIKINFSGFTKAIDAIGGIDVEVPQAIVDTEYPGANYSYEAFSIDAGLQHLDGETALKYARTRHSTSDFSRAGRQQQIISAAISQLKQNGLVKNVSNARKLLGIVSDNLETTFSSRELLSLAGLEGKLDMSKSVNIQLSDRNGLYGTVAEPGGLLYAPARADFGGASVLVPISQTGPVGNWSQIALFADILLHKREWFATAPRIAILNAGSPAGSARLLSNELTRYGFEIVSIDNFTDRDRETSFFLLRPDVPENPEQPLDPAIKEQDKQKTGLATFLSKTLGMTSMPGDVSELEEYPDIAIVLGKDFAYKPLSTLLSAQAEETDSKSSSVSSSRK